MECVHCKGKLRRGRVPFSADRAGYHISWESIPAWVCTQCGEALLDESEVNHIQRALREVDRETVAIMAGHP